MIKHPREYKIIGERERNYAESYDNCMGLRRLHPDAEIPHGYKEVLTVCRRPVYTDNGRLDYKLMAIKRYRIRNS